MVSTWSSSTNRQTTLTRTSWTCVFLHQFSPCRTAPGPEPSIGSPTRSTWRGSGRNRPNCPKCGLHSRRVRSRSCFVVGRTHTSRPTEARTGIYAQNSSSNTFRDLRRGVDQVKYGTTRGRWGRGACVEIGRQHTPEYSVFAYYSAFRRTHLLLQGYVRDVCFCTVVSRSENIPVYSSNFSSHCGAGEEYSPAYKTGGSIFAYYGVLRIP